MPELAYIVCRQALYFENKLKESCILDTYGLNCVCDVDSPMEVVCTINSSGDGCGSHFYIFAYILHAWNTLL